MKDVKWKRVRQAWKLKEINKDGKNISWWHEGCVRDREADEYEYWKGIKLREKEWVWQFGVTTK